MQYPYYQQRRKKFSFSGILAIIAVLLIMVFLTFFLGDPSEILQKSHDARRFSDVAQLTIAINLYLADGKNFDHLENKEYQSNNGSRKVDGTGWLPLNFQSISSGLPLAELPTDPSPGYFYRVGFNKEDKTFEINCIFENNENIKNHATDNGSNLDRYETGTDLKILK